MILTLDRLPSGKTAILTSIAASGELTPRLRDFGLIPGTEIICLRRAPSGSPILFRARSTMFALRQCDAEMIHAEVKQDADRACR